MALWFQKSPSPSVLGSLAAGKLRNWNTTESTHLELKAGNRERESVNLKWGKF